MVYEAASAVLLTMTFAMLAIVCGLWLVFGQVSKRQIERIALSLVAVALVIGCHPRLLPEQSRPIGSDSVFILGGSIQIGGRVHVTSPWQHRAAFLVICAAFGLVVLLLMRRPAPIWGWLGAVGLISLSVGLSVSPPRLELVIFISGGGGIVPDSPVPEASNKGFRLGSCFTKELFDLEVGTGGERRLGLGHEDALRAIDAALAERMALGREWPAADRQLLVWRWVARRRSQVQDEVQAARDLVRAFVEELAALSFWQIRVADGVTRLSTGSLMHYEGTLIATCRHPDRILALLEFGKCNPSDSDSR